MFEAKRILVTGGTGSFGHHIVRELLPHMPQEVRIFSRDEKKQWDMQREFASHGNLTFIIGDVRDQTSIRNAMRDVDIVFHAAALKQVPNCETNVLEAVRTNTLGAVHVIDAAIAENVERVVAISTDKAVQPVNVMGMTKALQERLFINANLRLGERRTRFACVRYGNVIGSRGSVIPLFKSQIEAGVPVTVTNPEMTRFLITLSQAIELVFQAVRKTVGGEIFVRKARSARVIDLAQAMIGKLAGKRTVEVTEVGIRPGEKIHEVLVSEEESWRTIEIEDSFVVLPSVDVPGIRETYGVHRNDRPFEYASNSGGMMAQSDIVKLLTDEGWC
jgi:FlaA1/EpsC-like NDP-sugar epimerase